MGVYSDLLQLVQTAIAKKSNIVVYTFAGSGSTRYLKQLALDIPGVTYINSTGQGLGDFNLLDLPLSDSLNYIRQVNIDQKYLLLIKSGNSYNSSEIKEIIKHTYFQYYLKTGDQSDISDMINRYQGNQDVAQVFLQSGGIPLLAKSIILDQLDQLHLVQDIHDSLVGYSIDQLHAFGLVDDNGQYLSVLLNKYSKNSNIIHINHDLSFTENNKLSKYIFTPVESKIIQYLLSHDNFISKEAVSDIKWGTDKYDEFSDQAINKQIRRLSSKLSIFSLKTIPKTGFKLIHK